MIFKRMKVGLAKIIILALFSMITLTVNAADKPDAPDKLTYTFFNGDVSDGYFFTWTAVYGADEYEYRYSCDWSKNMDKKELDRFTTKETSAEIVIYDAGIVMFQVRAIFDEYGAKKQSKWKTIRIAGKDVSPVRDQITINDEVLEYACTREEIKWFRDAIYSGRLEGDYEPVAVIGKKSSPDNVLLYLCQLMGNGGSKEAGWAIAGVRINTSGNAELINFNDINENTIKKIDDMGNNREYTKEWTAVEPENNLKMPKDAQIAFDGWNDILKYELPGITYKSIALLARKGRKKGTYFIILAHGAVDDAVYPDTAADYRNNICVLSVYMSVNGKIKANSTLFDLNACGN